MTTNQEPNVTRLKNSSLTRVEPVFKILLKLDPTGLSWLAKLIKLTNKNTDIATRIASMNCKIMDYCVELKNGRPKCFERSIVPSYAFLRWLIEHPERLKVPKNYGTKDEAKRENRKKLLGVYGVQVQQEKMREALKLLDEKGAQKSRGQWWAFEGYTRVDCLLETDDFILGIEGKRTDKESSRINWFSPRNQIIRNLEAIKAEAGSKAYAVLLMNEDGSDPILDADFSNSLPHYSPQEIQELKGHYLGSVSWRQACTALGIDPNTLPDTVLDIPEE